MGISTSKSVVPLCAEGVPVMQLCDNSGFDATDVLNRLRQKHALKDGSGRHFGVDVNTGDPSYQSWGHLTK